MNDRNLNGLFWSFWLLASGLLAFDYLSKLIGQSGYLQWLSTGLAAALVACRWNWQLQRPDWRAWLLVITCLGCQLLGNWMSYDWLNGLGWIGLLAGWLGLHAESDADGSLGRRLLHYWAVLSSLIVWPQSWLEEWLWPLISYYGRYGLTLLKVPHYIGTDVVEFATGTWSRQQAMGGAINLPLLIAVLCLWFCWTRFPSRALPLLAGPTLPVMLALLMGDFLLRAWIFSQWDSQSAVARLSPVALGIVEVGLLVLFLASGLHLISMVFYPISPSDNASRANPLIRSWNKLVYQSTRLQTGQ
jgi:hypothetical protein